jgi:hypothetical protein
MSSKERQIMTTNEQLELGFNGSQTRVFGRRRESRLARGQWWFARMREAVGTAMDWNLDPTVRTQPMFVSEQEEIRA